MATAAVALTVVDVDERRRNRIRRLSMAIEASTKQYASGGLTLDLTGVLNPSNFPAAKFGRNPTGYMVENQIPGYMLVIVPGTLLTNWKLQIFQDSGSADHAYNEFPNATNIPAAVSSDTGARLAFIAPKNL